mgnify:CR=1 FL=1
MSWKKFKKLFLIFNKAIPIVSKSFLYLVTETVCDNFYTNTDIRIDFMSKMGRALAFPTPFVVVGNFGILKHLKELGFKTFNGFIDENYDNEYNDGKRFEMICDEIKRLSELSLEEIHNWYISIIIPILEYNRNYALKFVKREARRGNFYQGILLDPPAYGRGPDGEKWILEEQIDDLLRSVKEILDKFQKVIGRTISITYSPRRTGDIPAIWAVSNKAQHLLNWSCMYDADHALEHAWRWVSKEDFEP